MPRTPLLSGFRELVADFEQAARSGRTVEAVQEERRQARLTRRDFLSDWCDSWRGGARRADGGLAAGEIVSDYKAGIFP
jgi:hypothetical protein